MRLQKRIKCWFLVFLMGIGVLSFALTPMAVYADPNADNEAIQRIRSGYNQLEEAAVVHLLMQNIYRCVQQTGGHYYELHDNEAEGIVVENGDIWYLDVFGSSRFSAYLELLVEGENPPGGPDSEIRCDVSGPVMVRKLADILKLGMVQILCDKDDPTMPGLIGRFETDGYGMGVPYHETDGGNPTVSYWKKKGNCNNFDGDLSDEVYLFNTVSHHDNDLSVDYRPEVPYLFKLYNWYVTELNKDGQQLIDMRLDTYGPVDGYFLYRREFETACLVSEEYDPDDPEEQSVYDVQFTDINARGEIEKHWIRDFPDSKDRYGRSRGGEPGYKQVQTFMQGGTMSCTDLLENMGRVDIVDGVRAALFNYIVEKCDEVQRPVVQGIIDELSLIINDTEGYSEEVRQNAVAKRAIAEDYMNDGSRAGRVGRFDKVTSPDSPPALLDPPADGYNWSEWPGLECIGSEELDGLTDVEMVKQEDPVLEPTPDPGDGGGTPGSVTASCYDGSGALGWILCPVLDGLGQAAEGMYEGLVEPFLRVDARLFDVGGSGDDVAGDNTFAAWQIFQGLANIVFIVLLLVVIFSQLTGVGIDSYGIRKILPKLIVAAILINLSYIICQLLVDVSNVMGFGARGMLSGIADGVGEISLKAPGMAQNLSVAGGYSAFGVIVGAVAVGAVVASGFAVLLPVLLAVLSAVIGIMFTFVLLGVRQAGVVLLVVISPLAFVCYMLPNTKSLFDRWRKLFQALLLFFPLCGLLMGAGDLSSKILLSTNSENIYMILIAMLLNIVPLFFLPTLLKGAFAAMGNIGAKISGLGKMASGGLTNRIRNSEGYKERQIAGRAAGASRMGKIAKSKFGQTRAGRLLFNRDGQVRARARAMAAQDKVTDANVSARKILAESRDAKTLTEGALENNIIDMLEAGNADGAAAEVAVAMDRLGASKGTTVLRYAMERAQAGGKLKAGGDVERDFMRMVNKSHGATISKKDYALGMSLSTGGHDKNGNHQTVQAAVGGLTAGDLKPEEAATLSKGSLARAFNSGAVDQVMARRVLEDDALRQKLDSTALAQWETIASGGAVFTATHTNLGGQRVDDSISGTNTYVDPVVAARNAQVAAQQQMATDQSAMRAAQQAHFTATQTHQSDVFMVQQQLVHSQHEEAARKQGPATQGPAKGLYEDPTGFNATNPLVGNVAINAKGEKWDRTRGKYL